MVRTPRTRHDGWTPQRQAIFLSVLQVTRCVSKAAASRMSARSAYALRKRPSGAAFAAAWDAALQWPVPSAEGDKGHKGHKGHEGHARAAPSFTPKGNGSGKAKGHETDNTDNPPNEKVLADRWRDAHEARIAFFNPPAKPASERP